MQLGLQPHLVAKAPIAAYVHIPFCRRRCYYCDFPVSVVGDRATGSTSGTIQRYVEVLDQEIQGMGTIAPSGSSPLQTVFFGGGTPSLLAPEQLDRLLTSLHQQFGLATGAEITIEMDPGTFDLAHIRAYQQAGINRVSLGVQAFQHDLLALCGRTHTVTDIYNAMDCLHQAGIENISLDLISGLPHQTLEQWQESLDMAIALAPTHLSCYDLIVEPKTAFSRRYQPGEAPLPTDAIAADMYRLAQALLTNAGYRHYEISNYARIGYECRHNQVYWRNQPYYGFGMGAASYLNGWRFTRPRKTQDYFAWVEAMLSWAQFPMPPCPQPPDLLETLMLALRTAEGISLDYIAAQYGTDTVSRLWNCLQPYYHRGLVVLRPEGDGVEAIVPLTQIYADLPALASGYRLQLQDPEGFLVSNTILADLFAALA